MSIHRQLLPRARGVALFAATLAACARTADQPFVSAGSVESALGSARFVDPAADTIARFLRRVVDEVPDIPGMSMAVVRHGEVVYVGAAGFRDVEARLSATAETPFYIASSTKSFTGMAAAVLAEDGKLDLDAPITRYIPELVLPAPLHADSVTMRSLLTHTIPFVNRPVVWRTAYSGQHSPSMLVSLLAHSVPREPGFQYDNLGYVIASLVLERVTGEPWQGVLDRVLFEPLGMSHTTAYMSEAAAWNVAAPYQSGERIPQLKTDSTMHAAGGMVTSAADLARWLEAQLEDGRVDGRQVLPGAAVREAHRRQATLSARFGPYPRFGYGLGWYWSTYEEDTLLHHFGGYAGARAHVSFMPEHGIGVAVLLNSSGSNAAAADVVANYTYDVLLGKPGREAKFDSILSSATADLARNATRLQQHRAEIAARPRTLTRSTPDYAGTYTSELLGAMHVRTVGDSIEVSIGQLRSIAGNYTEPNTIRVELDPGSGQVILFHVSPTGVDSLTMSGFVFRRTR
jgi:CubicO group peptidase (beta-lactamase class C family)